MKYSNCCLSLPAWVLRELNPAALRLLFLFSGTAGDVREAVEWERQYTN